MTGTTRTSAQLDPRRRRILFRSWHRGIREMDLVFGSFADAFIDSLSDAELTQFEELLAIDDRDLLTWVTGELPTPDEYKHSLFERICSYRPGEQ